MSNPLVNGAAVRLPSMRIPDDLKQSLKVATGIDFSTDQVERIAELLVTYVQRSWQLSRTMPPEDARDWYRGTASGARRTARRLQAACAGNASHQLALVREIGESRLAQVASDLRGIALEADRLCLAIRDVRDLRRGLFVDLVERLGVIVRAAGGSTSAQHNPGMETPFIRLVGLLEELIPTEFDEPCHGLRLKHANVGKAVYDAQRRARPIGTTMTRCRKKILTSSH